MAITDAERAAATYLASIDDPDARKQAAARISQLVRANTPAEEAAIKSPVAKFGEYRARQFDTPPFLLPHGQLAKGELHAMIARAGKGKTTLTMNRIVKWSAGLPLFDERSEDQTPLEGPMKILMIQNEGVAFFMQEKLDGLALALGDADNDLVNENLFIWGDGGYSDFKVDKEYDMELLRRALETTNPDVVTLEPFRGIWRGEENDSTAMEGVLDDLAKVAHDYKVAIMIGHHERKSGAGEDGEWMSAARGSGTFEGKVAVMENLRSVKNGEYTELSWSKRRYSTAPITLMRMQFNHATWALEYVPEDQVSDEILTLMHEDESSWYLVEEIQESLNETRHKIDDRLKKLVDSETIIKRKADRGGFKYRLNGHGMAANNNGGLDV